MVPICDLRRCRYRASPTGTSGLVLAALRLSCEVSHPPTGGEDAFGRVGLRSGSFTRRSAASTRTSDEFGPLTVEKV